MYLYQRLYFEAELEREWGWVSWVYRYNSTGHGFFESSSKRPKDAEQQLMKEGAAHGYAR